ncbi:MAG TPA: uL15 family ribosomal protein [Candidatus Limnocylindrales bacterium]|nr:uL15 family ribosomal protein [Candidatus Limnocylindrales bacterium]
MPHKLRKTRKYRGSRTVGYGRVGQHRDSGSKGQRKVGRHKHLWSYVVTHEPDYFGKSGFTSPQSLHRHENPINLKKLEELALSGQKETRQVDLTALGYTKLLGSGKVTKPLIVQVPSYSKLAAEKIKKAGGEILGSPVNGE